MDAYVAFNDGWVSDGLQALDTDSSGTVEAKEFMEFINKHPDMLAREGGELHLQYSLLAKLYAPACGQGAQCVAVAVVGSSCHDSCGVVGCGAHRCCGLG